MAQQIDLKARGLFTHPNPLGEVPPGGFLVADNVVIDREGTTETRRGLKRYGDALANVPKKLLEFTDRILVHHGTVLSYDSDGAGTWVNYSGSYTAPTGHTIRSILANKNLYFTTNAGIKKLDSLTGTPSSAGMYKGLDGEGVTTGASGFLANNANVAYRVVFGIYDANNNKILGAPSMRFLIGNNSGGTRDVNITFTLPVGLTTTHFYQIYRSAQTTALADEPNDELLMIAEKNPTSTDITNGYVTYTDSTPDNLRGATLYTSPSQEGILQANDPPPLAKDITLFKDCAFYFNTVTKHRLYITLISVGSPNGIQNDDTITIAGTTYTGKATENISSRQFAVVTGGTPAENIDDTARSLVRVINRNTTNTTVYAYYLTGFSDLPGKILIEERNIGGSQFVAISSRGSAFNPVIPSSGTTYASSNETEPNAIYVSKQQQPEAVPILNKLYAGAAQKDGLRCIALRDSVIILKEDGVFRLTGETPADFRVTPFDLTTQLVAIESAVPFNNTVTCYTEQGIASISDSGVSIISRSIEHSLFEISSSQFTAFPTVTYGCAYESDRKYFLGTVTLSSDTYATQIYVYNSVTESYTRWPLSMSCALVNPGNNLLHFGSALTSDKYIYQERKNFTETDYADNEYSVTITGVSGLTVAVASVTNLVVGQTLAQFNGVNVIRKSVITDIPDSLHVTVTDLLTWTNGAAKAYDPIPTTLKYVPIHGGNPAMVKLFQDFILMFSQANFNEMTVEFTSDQSIGAESFMISPVNNGGWGLFPWGSLPWGAIYYGLQPIRTLVPMEKSRAHWINFQISHSQALSSFSMVGISAFYEEISEIMK